MKYKTFYNCHHVQISVKTLTSQVLTYINKVKKKLVQFSLIQTFLQLATIYTRNSPCRSQCSQEVRRKKKDPPPFIFVSFSVVLFFLFSPFFFIFPKAFFFFPFFPIFPSLAIFSFFLFFSLFSFFLIFLLLTIYFFLLGLFTFAYSVKD